VIWAADEPSEKDVIMFVPSIIRASLQIFSLVSPVAISGLHYENIYIPNDLKKKAPAHF
jgi:hypothetical protein